MSHHKESDEVMGCLIHLAIIGILMLFVFPIIGIIITVIRLLLGFENIGFFPEL